jgi:hypothetical protein
MPENPSGHVPSHRTKTSGYRIKSGTPDALRHAMDRGRTGQKVEPPAPAAVVPTAVDPGATAATLNQHAVPFSAAPELAPEAPHQIPASGQTRIAVLTGAAAVVLIVVILLALQ